MLEVGCGYGRVLKPLSEVIDAEFTGADFSNPLLIKAREYIDDENIKLVYADANHLPFKDNAFDLVYTSAFMIHVPHKSFERICNELSRVARYIMHYEHEGDAKGKEGGVHFKHNYKRFYESKGLEVERINLPKTWHWSMSKSEKEHDWGVYKFIIVKLR